MHLLYLLSAHISCPEWLFPSVIDSPSSALTALQCCLWHVSTMDWSFWSWSLLFCILLPYYFIFCIPQLGVIILCLCLSLWLISLSLIFSIPSIYKRIEQWRNSTSLNTRKVQCYTHTHFSKWLHFNRHSLNIYQNLNEKVNHCIHRTLFCFLN